MMYAAGYMAGYLLKSAADTPAGRVEADAAKRIGGLPAARTEADAAGAAMASAESVALAAAKEKEAQNALTPLAATAVDAWAAAKLGARVSPVVWGLQGIADGVTSTTTPFSGELTGETAWNVYHDRLTPDVKGELSYPSYIRAAGQASQALGGFSHPFRAALATVHDPRRAWEAQGYSALNAVESAYRALAQDKRERPLDKLRGWLDGGAGRAVKEVALAAADTTARRSPVFAYAHSVASGKPLGQAWSVTEGAYNLAGQAGAKVSKLWNEYRTKGK
jgi:hypothetical protein